MSSPERNHKFVWVDQFTRRGPKNPAAFRVGIAGSNHDNGDGKGFFLSAETAADETPYSVRACKDALRELREAGWFVQTRRGGRDGAGRKWASEYALAIPRTDVNVQDSVNVNVQDSAPQRAGSRSQGAGFSTPVDPIPVDPSSVDPSSADPSSADPQRDDATTRRRLTKASELNLSGDPDKTCCIEGMSCPVCRGEAA